MRDKDIRVELEVYSGRLTKNELANAIGAVLLTNRQSSFAYIQEQLIDAVCKLLERRDE